MANLKRLINGQNLRFDTHQAGDAQATKWQHVHLEKILHQGGSVKFPLVGDFQPTVSSRIGRDQLESVLREVRHELRKDPKLVQAMAESVVYALSRFSSGAATIEDAKLAAKKFAKYFGLDENFVRTVEDYMGQRLHKFTSYHRNPDSIFLEEISFTDRRVEIRKSKRQYRPHTDSRRLR